MRGEFICDVSLHSAKNREYNLSQGGCLKPARFAVAALLYAAILLTLGIGFHRSAHLAMTGISFPRGFGSFALLLAPLWFFGFELSEPLKRLSGGAKISIAPLLALPYLVFSLGTPDFHWRVAVIVVSFPVLLGAFLEAPHRSDKMTWRDAAALAIVAVSYFLRWFERSWPHPTLALLPKLFLADVVLYCFLIIQNLGGAGYSLVPTRSALKTGVREWACYLPLALIIGELTHFIHFHAVIPTPGKIVADALITFLLIALPEELFFRSVLQNLLETRLGKNAALILASLLFGLSHFNHGATFNWRYILLAGIAGVFYGRAWGANRQIFAAIVTHTGVDVVWSLWFR